LATAIIGQHRRREIREAQEARPAIRPLTQVAISSASAIDAGIVYSANQKLFDSACQKMGSSASCR